MPCQHEQFRTRVSIKNPRDNADDPEANYSASIMIRCGICGQVFQFVGVSAEPSSERPVVAHEDVELRVPIRPKGALGGAKKGQIN